MTSSSAAIHHRTAALGTALLALAIVLFGVASASGAGPGRALTVIQEDDGAVFLSWRHFGDDPDAISFRLSRVIEKADDASPSHNTIKTTRTCHRDTLPPDMAPGDRIAYSLFLAGADAPAAPIGDATITWSDAPKPYLTIPLDGDYDVKKVGVGDLTGDGQMEFIIQQPNFNTDPYQQPGYWKKSDTTYKIEAYRQDGALLWRHDMGWSIEAGTWYAPWVVYDLDGDGKAEVYCKAGEGDPRDEKGLVQSGPEYLIKLDGATGEVIARTDWIGREGFDDYNYYCRNFLAVAYLDGQTPSLIMQRGTYRLIRTRALDKDFSILWDWNADQEEQRYRGQGAHTLIAADVTGDGRDEIVIGAAVLTSDGKGLWSLEMGHPDVIHVADIAPDNPGLEIFYGFETRQEKNGLAVVDARTGRILWGHDTPTRHIHNQGMTGDILAEYPGMEVLAGERDTDERWLYSASGELIDMPNGSSLSPKLIWWDDDPQKEVLVGNAIRDWDGEIHLQPVQGRALAIVDCLGDHREELIVSVRGELRVFSTTIPWTGAPRPWLMENRQYRLAVATQTMGYYAQPQLGPQ